MKQIRDPLYGYIAVNDAELAVIGMPIVQRLRCIQQLGLSSAVYPGATHSRFEHSLGVMYLAGRVAETLGLSEHERRAYRLAGLLHDVGHAPFSHATEAVVQKRVGRSHEAQSCRVVDGIANAMGERFPADPALVKDAIQGQSQYNIVAGAVDVDRMDYLRRDAMATGIPHGEIDTETIIRFATAHDGELVFDYKTLQAIEGLLGARTAMNKTIYTHHTSKIVETMLRRAVEQFLDATGTDASALLRWDDRQLHARLLEHNNIAEQLYTVDTDQEGHWTVPTAERVNETLYGRITTRDLFKRAFAIGTEAVGRDGLRELDATIDSARALEATLADEAGVPRDAVLVELPTIPTGPAPNVGIMMDPDVRRLTELSKLPRTITEAQWERTFLGVYTPADHTEPVARATRRLFGV
jgi:HD superfamily phosphohydrolase